MATYANGVDVSRRQLQLPDEGMSRPSTGGRPACGDEDSGEVNETEGGQLAAAIEQDPGDIEELARIRLQHSQYRALRRVQCAFAGGVLTLTGQVPTFHYKQLAQTVVADVIGVQQIVNAIDVG